jgi:hypothetical protein
MKVNVSERRCGLLSCNSFVTTAPSALGTSGASPSNKDADMDHGNHDKDNDNYEDNALNGDNNDD